MDPQQFATYTEGLTQLSREGKQAAHAAAQRLEQNKLTEKLIRQTVFCDGSSSTTTRSWIEDVSLAFSRAGQTVVIEIASSTVTGSLRKELERFLHEQIQSGEYDSRERVPWPTLRAHVSKTFLHVDESGALRDSLNNFRQSAYETDASFTRRYRDLAEECYPSNKRNIDQERILVRCFARGLRSITVAVKMVEQCNPQSLYEAMQWLASFSERNDVVSRLGLTTSEEVPMEISALPPPSPIPSQILDKVLRVQEHIMTKLAKLEASSSQLSRPSQGPPRRPRTEAPVRYQARQTSRNDRTIDTPNWSPDGQPKCFSCGKYGHFKRNCQQQFTNKREGLFNKREGLLNASRPQVSYHQGNR